MVCVTSPSAELIVLVDDELTAFVGDAGPLTDDYAPVDQLIGHRGS